MTELHPNRAAMRSHAMHLFGATNGDKDSRIELAWRSPASGKISHAQHFPVAEIEQLIERAVEVNHVPGQNVYIGAALRNHAHHGRSSDNDFSELTALYADFDDHLALSSGEAFCFILGMDATAKVITGRQPHMRAQLWWRLESPIRDAEKCRLLNRAISDVLGSDPSVVNPGRIMRLGGSIAWPTKAGRAMELTEFEEFSKKSISVAAVESALRTRLKALEQKSASKSAVAPSIPPVIDSLRNTTLTSLAGTMRRKNMNAAEIANALKGVNANRCVPPLPDSEVESIARSVARYEPAIVPEIMAAETSEDALALEFTLRHAADWRYVAAWGQWLHWNGSCWRPESTLRAFDLTREVCRSAAALSSKPKSSARIASAATASAVERLAKADRKHAATTDQWDCHPWLLNTPRGLLDLKTGELISHSRDFYLTKITDASPGTECPSWSRFLEDVTDHNSELQGYLARVVGYALTGITREHAMFFFYGTGSNGKSVFLNTLRSILGAYATTAAADTFLETKNDRHPTDLAGLRGARLVVASEIDQGRRWAESKLKSLTGGDAISARFMRQDFFEYRPQFKLLIAGNHKPAIRGVDEAMRRRLHLVPFTVTIPQERRDKNLEARLLLERDGILGWALRGCLEWQKIGLNPPEIVLGATREYFAAEDALGRWIDDACDKRPNATATTADLFASWKEWADHCGEWVGSEKRLATELETRGLSKWVQPGTRRRGFRGICLKRAGIEGLL